MSEVIPAQAVEAAAKELWDRRGEQDWSLVGEDIKQLIRADVTRTLEAAAPYMRDERGSGDYLPGWDDRKTLAGVWQEHAPLPTEGLSEAVYDALIAVATWGYEQRKDEAL